jgi:hypothetical protein
MRFQSHSDPIAHHDLPAVPVHRMQVLHSCCISHPVPAPGGHWAKFHALGRL